MLKKIVNPTENEVYINILGADYRISPRGFAVVEDSVAQAWKRIHMFLLVENHVETRTEVDKDDSEIKETVVIEVEQKEEPVESKKKKSK